MAIAVNHSVQTGQQIDSALLEKVLIGNDLSGLNSLEKVQYVKSVCESLGLNPVTKPIQLMKFQGKEVPYFTKDASEQLRKINKVSISQLDTKILEGSTYIVTAYATTPDGRQDSSTGVISITGLKGDALANAMMKAECVPLDYQILTATGFKNHLDIEIGESVAAYNKDNDSIEWVSLQEISVFPQQNVKNYSSSVTSFDFTEGHKWVSLSQDCSNADIVPFESIGDNGRILLAAKETENPGIDVTPDEAAILGWIITDGTIKKYKGQYYRASICQSKHENIAVIDALLDTYGVSKAITDNRKNGWKDQVWWNFTKDQTLRLFEKFSFSSLDDLPAIATRLNYKCREAMINSMMQADGDKRGHFGKGKLQVVECFQILCTLNGIALTKTKVRIFDNSTQPFYLLGKLTYTSVVRKYLHLQEEYIADVWCPTTKYGTWIMRSPEGQISITGNTKAKRRVTLSICGLGYIDESEVDSIAGARKIDITEVQVIPQITAESENNALEGVYKNWSAEILKCESIDALKLVFDVIKKIDFSARPDLFKKLIEEKDRQKGAIEFNKEWDGDADSDGVVAEVAE